MLPVHIIKVINLMPVSGNHSTVRCSHTWMTFNTVQQTPVTVQSDNLTVNNLVLQSLSQSPVHMFVLVFMYQNHKLYRPPTCTLNYTDRHSPLVPFSRPVSSTPVWTCQRSSHTATSRTPSPPPLAVPWGEWTSGSSCWV